MEINYNPKGKWSDKSVIARYRELSLRLGGIDGFEPIPRTYKNNQGMTWTYNIMDSVADGIQLGDASCVQLAIEYIEDILWDHIRDIFEQELLER